MVFLGTWYVQFMNVIDVLGRFRTQIKEKNGKNIQKCLLVEKP